MKIKNNSVGLPSSLIKQPQWFLLSIFLLSFNVTAVEKVYTLGYSPGSEYHTKVRDRIKLVYEKAGLKAKFIAIPHKRSVKNAHNGITDGDVGRNPVVETKFKNLRRVGVPISESLGSAYTSNENIKSFDHDQLKNYHVGYVHGVHWVEKLNITNAKTVNTYEQLAKMLHNKRIDIALGTDISMDAALINLGENINNIRKLNPNANISPTFHFVHKKNEAIIPLLEKTILKIKNDGYWDE